MPLTGLLVFQASGDIFYLKEWEHKGTPREKAFQFLNRFFKTLRRDNSIESQGTIELQIKSFWEGKVIYFGFVLVWKAWFWIKKLRAFAA